jgi:ribonucleoside-diphosphate reductase alpha chain
MYIKIKNNIMYVINRSHKQEPVSFDKVLNRLANLKEKYSVPNVNVYELTQETVKSIHDGITTAEIDNVTADICVTKVSLDIVDYNQFGGIILADNIAKELPSGSTYSDTVERQFQAKVVNEKYYTFVMQNADKLNAMIDTSRDYLFDYFAMKTLMKSYLLLGERPQYMWARVAVQVSSDSIESIKTTYDLLSQLYYTHATPTLSNSGTLRLGLASCYLLGLDDDLTSIMESMGDIAQVSKFSGGVGISITKLRSRGSIIKSTNGRSNGVIPLCKMVESLARYIDQGGSKRKGSVALYTEPWVGDIYEFLDLRKPTGDENLRARDLFLGLMIPDIFMERVQTKSDWTLFCPSVCPLLTETCGEEFTKIYLEYEAKSMGIRTVKAEELWRKILEIQLESGMPYITFKDTVNQNNMQSHLGIIKNSNLCNEISIYSDSNNIGVCNLASISLPKFISENNFDFEKLSTVAGIITENLNHVIDRAYYPIEKAERTNISNRPIGIGIQGLADVFMILGLPFGSPEAIQLSGRIMEAITFGATKSSIKLAELEFSYPSYTNNSNHSNGKLHHMFYENAKLTMDWDSLIPDLKKFGIRNSLLTALMPTASTSQILGNIECFEPITTNVYVRKTNAGEFIMVNKHLVRDLKKNNLWNQTMKREIILANGSIQGIPQIPDSIKAVYRTAYEVKLKDILDHAIARQPFVDQQQSMNYFINSGMNTIHSGLFYAWKNKLKTGVYYTRTEPAVYATKFGMGIQETTISGPVCNKYNKDCEACSA